MNDAIDQIMALMDVAFDPQWNEAWNRRQLTDALQLPSTHYRLIDEAGESPPAANSAAGFALVRAAPDEEELLLIAVHPAMRGQGLGSRLLSHVLADARRRGSSRVFLEMRANNPAEVVYRKAGFTPIGRRRDYYRTSDGERIDAITFACEIE